MGSFFMGLLEWAIGFIFKKKVDPSTAQLADSNARAQDIAQQAEATNAVVTEAAQARTDADTQRVLNDPSADQVESDPHAAINQDLNLHLRP